MFLIIGKIIENICRLNIDMYKDITNWSSPFTFFIDFRRAPVFDACPIRIIHEKQTHLIILLQIATRNMI